MEATIGTQEPEEEDGLTVAARKRVGDVLNDKWRLDQLLGVGGMAAVYAATHRNGNRVAVKLLHPHCVANDGIRLRFQREGYVANKIEHPGSVRVLDDDSTSDGAVFLVMDLLEGETLEARLTRRGRMPAEEALSIVYHLLDVLHAAHGKGVVHRDVKLDNVFLTRVGEVKVLDFGIARLAETTGQQNVAKTRTNAMMGTPAFMAPEQALGRANEIDAQTDLWAVGATLFRLLTGRNVHEAATLNEQLVHAATRPAPPLQSVLSDAPAQLALVVDRALAFLKVDRWPSAIAMMEAMRPLLRATPSGQMPRVRATSFVSDRGPTVPLMSSVADEPVITHTTGGSPKPAKPQRLGLALALVGLGVGVVAGAWVLLRRTPGAGDVSTPAAVAAPAVLPLAPPVTKPTVVAKPATSAVPLPPPEVKPPEPPPASAAAAAADQVKPPVKTKAAHPRSGSDRGKPSGGRPSGERARDDEMWDRRH